MLQVKPSASAGRSPSMSAATQREASGLQATSARIRVASSTLNAWRVQGPVPGPGVSRTRCDTWYPSATASVRSLPSTACVRCIVGSARPALSWSVATRRMSAGVRALSLTWPSTGMIHRSIEERSETNVPGRTMYCRRSSHCSAQHLTVMVANEWTVPSAAMRRCASVRRARTSRSVRAFKVRRCRVPRSVHPTSIAATHCPREFR